LTSNNFLGHFLFGFNASDVFHVISDGKLIVENRNLVSVNEKEILAEAQVHASRLWKKMK
jgi:hypothetical protein